MEREYRNCGPSCCICFNISGGAVPRHNKTWGMTDQRETGRAASTLRTSKRPECGNTCQVHVIQASDWSGTAGPRAGEGSVNSEWPGCSLSRIPSAVDTSYYKCTDPCSSVWIIGQPFAHGVWSWDWEVLFSGRVLTCTWKAMGLIPWPC